MLIQVFKIESTIHETLPKPNVPCHKDQREKKEARACIEDYIEKRIGCNLPWRNKHFDAKQRGCATGKRVIRKTYFIGPMGPAS